MRREERLASATNLQLQDPAGHWLARAQIRAHHAGAGCAGGTGRSEEQERPNQPVGQRAGVAPGYFKAMVAIAAKITRIAGRCSASARTSGCRPEYLPSAEHSSQGLARFPPPRTAGVDESGLDLRWA